MTTLFELHDVIGKVLQHEAKNHNIPELPSKVVYDFYDDVDKANAAELCDARDEAVLHLREIAERLRREADSIEKETNAARTYIGIDFTKVVDDEPKKRAGNRKWGYYSDGEGYVIG